MLSLPDFKEKQILFVISERGQENRLQFRNDNILFAKNGKAVNQLSCYKVFAIFIVGDFSITTVLIKNCKQYGISLFLLKNNFEFYASIISVSEGNYLLRARQYNLKNELELARLVIKNKVYNQLCLLRENNIRKGGRDEFSEICQKIDKIENAQELLGVEGDLTKKFFIKYFREIDWHKRMPRAKVDVVNVLLDIGYTFLFNFVDALLNLYGFDTYKGFYHKLFFQRKSLSCDLMEPFRCLIDRQILKSYRLKQINDKDFKFKNGKYILSYDKQQKYLKIFFDCLLERKEDLFNYARDFYYCILNDKKDYPFFKLNQKLWSSYLTT